MPELCSTNIALCILQTGRGQDSRTNQEAVGIIKEIDSLDQICRKGNREVHEFEIKKGEAKGLWVNDYEVHKQGGRQDSQFSDLKHI